ncbi:HlyD family efflux transporter periplasmic adaptor subunit [Bremerella cremea]|uniref:HlyD family efflux transporter periplasmic adaptor subunit n=1 Tax=Bremerella cremea TaxID=1031537 RepID=A0A368KRA6_9BACT|nr:HlyD family efflux transporter periplasmic adaptor subunit [Bremerella cremea]RCS49415.1 HlyD family efflux transporter periplasmic adaptor subunit [Bremerella cremea]
MSTSSVQDETILRSVVRVRPDLVYARRIEEGEEIWVVKDPITLRYFHFGPAEVFIMRLVDGRHGLSAIKKQYDTQFAPQRISQQEIVAFCHRLHQRGLLISSAENQADTLLRRRQNQQWMKWASLPLHVLAIRLPGIDPERFLTATQGAVRWLFHRTTIAIVLSLALLVLLLGLLNLETITTRLPDQSQFFRGENLVILLVTMVLVKVLHELGHAYCCKTLGGECHQLGVLLMVFAPAMYCEVSDAWLFPKRWQRILVSAAGMYVEVILAMLAFGLWFFARPGAVSDWLLNIVFVCGVSTLLVNANPLLRYDGYYILADVLNLPNLSSRASEALWIPIRNWFQRRPRTVVREPKLVILRIYAVLAIVYRTLVFALILWFLYLACRTNDIIPVWHVVVTLFLVGILLRPAMMAFHWLRQPRRKGQAMLKRRVLFATGLLLLMGAGLALIPIPTRIHVPVIAEIKSDYRVYVQIDGTVLETLSPDTQVYPGDVLATLVNEDLTADLLKTAGEIKLQRQHLASLKLRASNRAEVAAQIPTAESALQDLLDRETVLKRKADQLLIRSPEEGVVISAPRKFAEGDSARFLPTWSGDPLDRANRGCFLQRGDLLCLIGDKKSLQARLFVSQDQIELIRPGDQVSILFDGMATHAIRGTVQEVSTDQTAEVPRNLSRNLTLRVQRQNDGSLALADGAFSVTVDLSEHDKTTLLPGTTGRAVVVGRSQTVWQIVARFLQLNFRFFS